MIMYDSLYLWIKIAFISEFLQLKKYISIFSQSTDDDVVNLLLVHTIIVEIIKFTRTITLQQAHQITVKYYAT